MNGRRLDGTAPTLTFAIAPSPGLAKTLARFEAKSSAQICPPSFVTETPAMLLPMLVDETLELLSVTTSMRAPPSQAT
jgi:hypothetical protein